MKLIDLNHKDLKLAQAELKNHSSLCGLGSIDGVYKIICRCDEAKVDDNDNGYITQDELVNHVKRIDPNKTRKEIIKAVDTNDNGRITKRELSDFIKKGDK